MTDTTTLPGWDEMTDVDKGCALLHLHKRDWEGASYAVREYPCEYLDDPRLTALTPKEACRHAVKVDPGEEFAKTDEHHRLYNLALDEPDRRKLWGACVTDARVITATDPAGARGMLASWAVNETRNAEQDPPPSWWKPADRSVWAVMHRAEAGGQWHEVGGCAGCRGGAEQVSMETRFDTTQHGDPQLTITLDGAHDLFRFAVNMLNDQCEFSRAGRKALATLRSHLGPAQFDPWAAGVLGDQRYERLRDLGMFEYDEGI